MRRTGLVIAVVTAAIGCNTPDDRRDRPARLPVLIGDGVYQEGMAVVELPGGGYAIAGQRSEAPGVTNPGPSVYVIRIDDDLDIVWESVLTTPETVSEMADTYAADVAVTADGTSLVVVGYRQAEPLPLATGYAVRVDLEAGGLGAEYVFDTVEPAWKHERFEAVWALPDGGALLVGTTSGGPDGESDVLLVHLGPDFLPVSEYVLASDEIRAAGGLAMVKSGRILVGGSTGVAGTNALHGMFTEVATSGALVGEAVVLPQPGHQNLAHAEYAYVESAPDLEPRWGWEGLLVLGSSFGTSATGIGPIESGAPVAHAVQEDGTVVWATAFDTGEAYWELNGATELTSAGAVLVGSAAGGPIDYDGRNGLIVRIDANGQTVSDPEILGGAHEQTFHDAAGTVAVGVHAGASGSQKQVWVVPIDE